MGNVPTLAPIVEELRSIGDIDFQALCGKSFHPSPVAWEDQVFYFLLPDRFSDGRETRYFDNVAHLITSGSTLPYDSPRDWENAITSSAEAEAWREAGRTWVGGTLKGLERKIGYLNRLGVSALWIGPIFAQVPAHPTYHGYAVQNFLDVDSHFGNRADLRSLVKTAHEQGIYVILDIILNHAGDVFSYGTPDPLWTGVEYPVSGYNDNSGQPAFPFPLLDDNAWLKGGVWPQEFNRDVSVFTRKGHIGNWDYAPEYLEGDFGNLKDINLGCPAPDGFLPTRALNSLCEVYKFWIADADLDGFRIDTVKHMGDGPTRYFNSVIHEFSQSIGKENFLLVGEVTGGREKAFETVETTGLDAALGIGDVQDKMEYLVKGYCNPSEYFELFRNSLLEKKQSHAWFRNKVVTNVDDHDQIRKGNGKARFCAGGSGGKLVLSALALNATTLGIPCFYYGTEQGFDGAGGDDRYIREAMCGGRFGAFRSKGRHFFNEQHPVYMELAKILKIRKQEAPLRRGRQYLREISGNGLDFGLPQMIGGQIHSVIPWSRIFANQEILCAINTDPDGSRSAWVTIDNSLHQSGDHLTCLYSTDSSAINGEIAVEARNGKAVNLTIPSGGFVMYK